MSLSCYCESDDPDWWFTTNQDFSTLSTKRGRKCCSCRTRIAPGDCVLEFRRWRNPKYDVEDHIYGECGEVPLAPWFMCEVCGGLFFAIEELDMCCDIQKNIASQIREFREVEREERR
jgi:hypothetical protein